MMSKMLLFVAMALATAFASPQSLRGSVTSSKSLIYVTEDHVSTHAKLMNLTLKNDWRAMLAAAPQYVMSQDDLSPLLLRSLHSAAAPYGTKWALAVRTTAPSSFTTTQYHNGAWMLSDLLVATGATSITCTTSPKSKLVQMTLLRDGVPLSSMADLDSARNNLFDDHASLTSSLHGTPTHQGQFDAFLARALGDGTDFTSPLIVDTASASVLTNTGCTPGQAFVFMSSALNSEKFSAVLRPATSPVDIYNSIDSVFGLSDDNCIPTGSPTTNIPCTLSGTFPTMNLNYNSGNGGATQAITLNSGVTCPDCWATFSSAYSGSFQMCVYDGFGVGTNYCTSSTSIAECQFFTGSGCFIFANLTVILTGDLEVELDVSAGQVPVGVDNTVFYAFTAATGDAIPLATGVSITPGFQLGSRVTTSSSASKSPGLNGSASWIVHAGTGSNPGLEAGFSWSVVWPSLSSGKGPDEPVFTPIGTATPNMKVNSPYFNGLAASNLDAKISLVPQIQFNLTVGISDPITADAVMPFSFSPTVYLDMQTGDPGSTPPSGVSAHCPDKFDTWYALMYGSDLDLGFGGLTINVDLPTGSISKTVAAPTATVLPLATPAPLPGDGTSGCVSKTWVPPHPPAPPTPPGGNSGSGGGSSGALIGGIIGGIIALAIAGGAAYYFLVLKRGKGEDSGDYAAVALN